MKHLLKTLLPAIACWLACTGGTPAAEPSVSLLSLLREMIDPAVVARWPQPDYLCKQASSYDRRSKTPSDPATWFANGDNMESLGEASRWEDHQGRQECVLMDVDGPGAVVRVWTGEARPKGHLRFYLDGAETPALDAPFYELLSGRDFVPRPLAIENAGAAGNLYLPVPYAKHCKITYDEGQPPAAPPGRWFNIEYRVYAPGTQVEAFTMGKFKTLQPLVEEVAKTLSEPPACTDGQAVTLERELEASQEASVELPTSSRAAARFE
jgi:hypothetical protein